jgi:protein involved in polysaccharide export with SLBB domain
MLAKAATRSARFFALLACLPLGCSSGPGNRFILFPEAHRLTDAAREMRQSARAPADLPRELDKSVSGPYTVEPGDVLLVQPVSLDSPVRLPGDQPVLPDGSIHLGRYGRLVVAGKTVEQIEAEVNALIGARVAGAGPITVRLVMRESKVYYVLGEVNAPGAFQFKGRETVLDALLAAGGPNGNASRNSIILVRPTPPGSCRLVLPICYDEIVQLGDTSTNYQVQAGDRIFVPSRCWGEGHTQKKRGCLPCGAPATPCPLPPACSLAVPEPR